MNADSNTVIYDVTNVITHRIFNTNSQYSRAALTKNLALLTVFNKI